jgi:hypothetical protein
MYFPGNKEGEQNLDTSAAFSRKTVITFITLAALLLAIILIYNGVVGMRMKDDIKFLSRDTEYSKPVKLEKFTVYSQQYSWSCGPTTISMVYTYLIGAKNEMSVLEENRLIDRKRGMQPLTFRKYLKDTLKGYDVELKNNITDSQVIKIIYGQLSRGIPVPVYFSTINDWDRPHYDTHYSAVTGIDLNDNTVIIANAYGYEEKININDFLTGLKYENYKDEPAMFKLATMLGIIKKNNIYVLTR